MTLSVNGKNKSLYEHGNKIPKKLWFEWKKLYSGFLNHISSFQINVNKIFQNIQIIRQPNIHISSKKKPLPSKSTTKFTSL